MLTISLRSEIMWFSWIAVFAVTIGASWGCSGTEEIGQEKKVKRENYLVTVKTHLERSAFDQAPGLDPIQPYSEGYFYMIFTPDASPVDWQFSQSQEITSGGIFGKDAYVTVYSPFVVVPDAEIDLTFRVPLPNFICGVLLVIEDHFFESETETASAVAVLTSQCVPIPAELAVESAEEAKKRLPPPGAHIPEILELSLDSPGSSDVFHLNYTFPLKGGRGIGSTE
ncbi:hypothetical protein ACFL6C_11530 [Myxococcota bacterium]